MRRWINGLQLARPCAVSDQQRNNHNGGSSVQRYSFLKREAQIAMLNLWPRATMACLDSGWLLRECLKFLIQIVLYYQICLYLHKVLFSWISPGTH